ncbi:inositol polyphosphate 5-phosphatase OCRL-1 isoform X1 [Rhizophagus clarus]|uniref:Inositol polyphosphate 5-phosphatase OCRL-1 isoform X1 n=1 Tax=Rhizophagus clarus TaxID=94130 RepID=A0A8H3LGG5_9GLOM|nr:inositol polyphosphate 5-phosphatase OCRL-1 isoform X1 [Rhizophagus clarus]
MSLTVLVGTYNLNQRLLKKDLTNWLFTSSSQSLPEKPDIIAIGFQEFNEYPNAFLNINNKDRIKHCEEMIEEAIFNYTKERYFKEISSIFNGLALVIYVRDEGIKSKIKSKDVEQVGVGPIWAGNKGAIAARLMVSNINDTISICFICAHLAPHSHNVVKRNKDFKKIEEKNKEHLIDLLNAKKHQSVIEFDQLNIEKRKGLIFNGFKEGEIKFPPTYKYNVGSIETFNYSKRIPGWCDRILYSSSRIESIVLHQYTSNNNYITSDHKPVSALFTISLDRGNNNNIINWFTKYNFKIDKWRFIKKIIGNFVIKIFGLLWWLVWTKIIVALIGIFVGWYFYYS